MIPLCLSLGGKDGMEKALEREAKALEELMKKVYIDKHFDRSFLEFQFKLILDQIERYENS